MKKIFNYFTGIIYKYFSNGGDQSSIVSFSGGFTDFFTILWMMVVWYVGFDILKVDWLYDFWGIILVYFTARIFSIITTLLLSERFVRNQRKRYLKSGFWLLIPYMLIFFLAFWGDEDVDVEDNWEGGKWGLFD